MYLVKRFDNYFLGLKKSMQQLFKCNYNLMIKDNVYNFEIHCDTNHACQLFKVWCLTKQITTAI